MRLQSIQSRSTVGMLVPDYLESVLKKLKAEHQIEIVPPYLETTYQDYKTREAKLKATLDPIFEEFKNRDTSDKRYSTLSNKDKELICNFIGRRDVTRSEASRYVGRIEYKDVNGNVISKAFGEFDVQNGSNPVPDGHLIEEYYEPDGTVMIQTMLCSKSGNIQADEV